MVFLCNTRPRSHGPRPLSPARLDGMMKGKPGKRHEVKAQNTANTETEMTPWHLLQHLLHNGCILYILYILDCRLWHTVALHSLF